MKSSPTSLDINSWQLHHLDVAYIVVLLPLLLIIKLPMLIFMGVVVSLILLKKEPSTPLMLGVTSLGVLAIFVSLYGTFNLAGLSRLKLFLELLIYMLIFAISLQRLKREVNFYLRLSPILLLAFSLFFFDSVTMLGYVIFEMFALLWLILNQRMRVDFRETLKMSATMFAFSIPWVVILFIFFPRISFDHATYGFKGDVEHRMGHDGTMFLDNNALLVPSDKIVMEVGFEGDIPPSNQLYFRGSVLYTDKKDHWEKLPRLFTRNINASYPETDDTIKYKVTLYPTDKRWIYQLDMPLSAPEIDNKKVVMSSDFISTTREKIRETLHYESKSVVNYSLLGQLDAIRKMYTTDVDDYSNPKSWKIAEKIVKSSNSAKERINMVIDVFKKSNLTYTLKPDALDLNNSTDSFLFGTKRGYCVHFASSFATMARMVGIPSRVVTGYRGNRGNGLKNYLIIKEKDAHAWVELLIDRHWVRYETTAFASKMDEDTQLLLNPQKSGEQSSINLYLMYIKYQIDTWVLNYSHIRQLQLLNKAQNNPWFIVKFIGSIILIILFSYILIARFRRPVCYDELLCIIAPLIDRLKESGYRREDRETMHQFLQRYIDENPNSRDIEEIDRLYEEIRYGGSSSQKRIKTLKEMVERSKIEI